ncbi:MAG: hypothetical protein ACTIIT_08750, partial [Brevibacterium linens]
MPNSHHSIADGRAQAIRAIAENSQPLTDRTPAVAGRANRTDDTPAETRGVDRTTASGSAPAGVPSLSDGVPALSEGVPALPDGVPALSDREPVLGLMDLDAIDTAFERLTSAFDSDHEVLHAVACKAVPLR